MQADEILEKAVNKGAEEGKVISPDEVFTAEWVRLKCQYGCGGYGEKLTCPPYSPTPEQTEKVLKDYERALLIHFPSDVDNVKSIMAELERDAFLSGYYKAFAMGAGPCYLCEECKIEEGCVHPHEARPAMEACGIDVYRTAREAGFSIEVVEDRSCTQNYYGLLLLK
ncbi:MAG: DUF2284 domain-containing protein [Candidatus Thermoplasmatota archaeon]